MIPVVDPKREALMEREELLSALSRVIDSGMFILGDEVKNFEKEFAAYIGGREGGGDRTPDTSGIAVASGTDALTLSLMAMGVGPGDGVITVPNSAFPTACAISRAGGVPVFVDVDPVSYTMSPERLNDLLTGIFDGGGKGNTPDHNKIKSIIPVHLYGQTAEMESILEIARKFELFVLEDCAQAHGALYQGRMAGTMGDISAFSFYPTKNLPALGDGGMVVTDDGELAGRVRHLRDYGQREKYIHEDVGMNSRMDDIQGAVLRLRLKSLDDRNDRRREIASKYDENVKEMGNFVLPREMGYGGHVYHLYVIQTENRDRLMEYLRENDIGSAIHYPLPIHLQSAYRGLGYKEGDFPVCEALSKKILSIPLFPELTNDEVGRVIEVLNGFPGAFRGNSNR